MLCSTDLPVGPTDKVCASTTAGLGSYLQFALVTPAQTLAQPFHGLKPHVGEGVAIRIYHDVHRPPLTRLEPRNAVTNDRT
jgi:hypothetical protein